MITKNLRLDISLPSKSKLELYDQHTAFYHLFKCVSEENSFNRNQSDCTIITVISSQNPLSILTTGSATHRVIGWKVNSSHQLYLGVVKQGVL